MDDGEATTQEGMTQEEKDLRFLRREIKKMARVQQHMREKFNVLHDALNRMHEAVERVSPFEYPNELKPIVALEGTRRDLQFLSFAGLNLGMGMPPFEFLRSFRERNVPGYFLKDFHQSWYLQGVLGISNDIHGLREHLQGLVKGREGARLVTLGASSGGYAAIVLGCWLGARKVAAFSPQTSITKRVVAQYAALDTPEATDFLRGSEGVLNLRDFIVDRLQFGGEKSPIPEITVYYGAEHPTDAQEARRLEGLPNVTLVPVEGVQGHSVTAALKQQGKLSGILDRLMEP